MLACAFGQLLHNVYRLMQAKINAPKLIKRMKETEPTKMSTKNRNFACIKPDVGCSLSFVPLFVMSINEVLFFSCVAAFVFYSVGYWIGVWKGRNSNR